MPERVFLLPDLGEGLEEADVATWLVREGDVVTRNQPIAEVETAKATVEIPSPYAGRIVRLHVGAGASLAVGAPFVTFDVEGQGSDAAAPQGTPPATIAAAGAAASTGVTTGSDGASATPAVRRLAKDLGVDLASVTGSGPGGRITREDVEAAAGPRPTTSAGGDVADDEVVPLTPVRRAVAAAMSTAAAIPQVTTFRTLDATALEDFRSQIGTSPLPIFVRALAGICAAHPTINASWSDDGIRLHRRVHVGVATATERGLVVPVVADAQERGIADIAEEIRRLAASAREGSVQGGRATISVSNTGSYGSEAGTPLLNPPNAVTIALGVIQPRALVVDGRVEARPAATISATFDHRVLDGADLGRALGDLIDLLQDPARLAALPR